ncbi:MAG: HAD-IC family P-type ATPase [Phycisphaerales bacterium]|nr:HAD-IC family P-type ATPase [Phycisphaerales bacterium]
MNYIPALPWHAVPAEEVITKFVSNAHDGLTAAEAAARLARHGRNTITATRGRPWWVLLLLQFHTPLVYLLIFAGGVTLWLGEHTDSGVIFGVVIINAIIGFVQEGRAVKAINALARSMRILATVKRDGQRISIEAADLVAGDIVVLEAGAKVPADLRLLDGSAHGGPVRHGTMHDLRIDESTLTGESKPVSKQPGPLPATAELAERLNMAYAGSLVVRGAAEGVVVAIADVTEVGRISGMIASAEEIATPLTKKLASLSRTLLWVILGVAALACAVGIARGNPPGQMFKAAVAIAVGAIPEGLPAAVTIMLAVGVTRMARRKAIIRRLSAVEALGATTVICSDKTGTLTQNQMTVQTAWAAGTEYEFTGAGYDPSGVVRVAGRVGADRETLAGADSALSELLKCGVLCNGSSLVAQPSETIKWAVHGDPTEAALIVSARKFANVDLSSDALADQLPRVDAIPFESERQYMATLHARTASNRADAEADPANRVIYVKGSVERVLAMSVHQLNAVGSAEALDRDAVHRATAELARRGLRVLAFARGTAPSEANDLTHPMVETAADGLTFLGLQGMLDPPRPEAVQAVAACQRAGVLVKMITGDHALTALTIAEMIGIEGAQPGTALRVLTGAEMAAISDEDLPERAQTTTVFARMTPEQKLRLVKALQSGTGGHRHIVAMTGDGVNDAPALRQADIGVAMGTAGTEVAKDAADIVLADDNFASIEAAIEEGRSVYSNLTKFIVWTLPTNGEALVIIAAIAMGSPLPILPVQALYINMATAVLLGIPLIFERKESGIMSLPPRDPARPLLTFELFMRTGLVSVMLCAGAMVLFQWELGRGMGEPTARTAAVSAIVVGETFYLFSARALLRSAWSVPLFSNAWLWVGIGAMIVVQAAFAHTPLMNRLFHSAPLDVIAWARVLAVGAATLVIVETEKAIRRAVGRKAIR